MFSNPLTHEPSGKAENDPNPEAWFPADHYKPFFCGTEGSKVKSVDLTRGPPNTENSTIMPWSETVSLRVTPVPKICASLHILDFVDAKNPKERIEKPVGFEIRVYSDHNETLTVEPTQALFGNEARPGYYNLHPAGFYEIYSNGERARGIKFEHKPVYA